MMKRCIFSFKIFVVFYSVVIFVFILSMKFYLSTIVFKHVEKEVSHENSKTTLRDNGDEIIVRFYSSVTTSSIDNSGACVVFFPGRHGGITRYEKEIFLPIQKRGIPLYVLSYPGYEGAKGKSTFKSVTKTVQKGITYIHQKTKCKIDQAVFIGRSLGGSIALHSALVAKRQGMMPRGLLLDSVSPSLAVTVAEKLRRTVLFYPLSYLPISSFLEFDVQFNEVLSKIPDVPIVIFQGGKDTFTGVENMNYLSNDYRNVSIILVPDGKHSNTHIKAGEGYWSALKQLIGSNE